MKKHTAPNMLIGAAFALAALVALLWLMSAAPRATRAAPEARPATAQRASPLSQAGTVITVCASGCDYSDIQDAVDAAPSGAEIKIAEGVYTDAHTSAETPLVYITQSLTLRGGYSISDWNNSDPINHPTTLDALGQGRVVHIDNGTVTIENLRMTGGHTDSEGGGINNEWSHVDTVITISNCVVISNTAQWAGGGLSVGGNVNIISSTIAFNTAGACGGLSSWGLSQIISNTFMSNVATLGEGGGACLGGGSTLSANVIVSNTAAEGWGGGLRLSGNVTVSANTIRYNTASRGGGVSAYDALTLSANMIADNAAQLGGGLYLIGFSDETRAQLDNNFIVANTATASGSAIFVSGANPTLRHNTLARNSGGDGNGIHITTGEYSWYSSTVVMINNILVSHTIGIVVVAGNAAHLEGTLWGAGAWANQTDWIGWGTITTGTVNVHGDPAFVDPAAGNYHILPTSAAVDAGVGTDLYVDADGEPRPMRHGFDIGADESPGPGLRLSMTAPQMVNLGQAMTYDLAVAAVGAGGSKDVVLTDTLPIQQHAVNVTSDQGTCALGAGWGANILCYLGDMNLGAVAHITLTTATDALPAQLPLLMRNTAVVRSDQTSVSAYRDVVLQDCHVRLNDDPTEWNTVQAGVDASTQATDIVKVAGVCTDLDPPVIQDETRLVYITKSLTLRGGYSVADWNTSDPTNHPTTLDALGQGGVVRIDNGTVTIESLRMTGGHTDTDGGGISNEWSHVDTVITISNCVVISNTAYAYSGGGLAVGGNVNIIGSTIAFNTAENCGGLGSGTLWGQIISSTFMSNVATKGNGGGLCLWDFGTLSANVIVSNTAAEGWGGGLHLGGNVTVSANTIRYNTASRGGGVSVWGPPTTLSANMIADNAAQLGGGLYLAGSFDEPGAQLDKNLIVANTASAGGGVFVDNGATLSANTITANSGGGVHVGGNAGLDNNYILANTGDGINVVGANPILRHNTIARNTGYGIYAGASVYWPPESQPQCFRSSLVSMMNNIVVGHAVGVRLEEDEPGCWSPSSVYLWGTLWGSGAWANQTDWIGTGVWDSGLNLHGDPAFLDPAAGNYHISKRSAARDAGVNSGLAIDADGDPRPFGPGYDIGADEYAGNHAPYVPRNPIPPDGALSQPLWPTLSWQGGDPDYDPVTYTVAFGPVNPPTEVTTTLLTSLVPTGLLSDTTYYWAITATDGLSATMGSLWSFTTGKEFSYLPLILKAASQ